MNFSGRSGRAAARRVIEIEDVLEPMMAPGLSTGQSAGKDLALQFPPSRPPPRLTESAVGKSLHGFGRLKMRLSAA